MTNSSTQVISSAALAMDRLPGVQRPKDELTQRMQNRVERELEDADAALLVLNAIRSLYFEHAADLPVTARPGELAPLYARAARAIERGDAPGAARAVQSLAALQRRRVEEALGA